MCAATLIDTTDALLSRYDQLDLRGLSVAEVAELLRQQGAAHLSPIKRIELAERLITRRRFLIGAGALALGMITGCGTQEQTAAPTATVATTRTVVDGLGRRIEVPAVPQRVVALHDLDNAYALASLGFAPLGMGSITLGDPFERLRSLGPIPPALEQTVEVGLLYEPNLEAIAALQPDLILGTRGSHEQFLDQLTAIAPTVLIDQTAGDDVLSNQRFLASLVGVEDRIDEQLARYEARIAALRERYADTLNTLEYTRIDSYGVGAEDNYLILFDLTPGTRVLTDLGARRSKTNGNVGNDPFPAISLERLADYDADVIFIGVEAGTQPEPQILQLLSATFAGQNNQIFAVDYGVWGFRLIDALFIVLNDIEQILSSRSLNTAGDFR